MSALHTTWLILAGILFIVWTLRLLIMGPTLRTRKVLSESSFPLGGEPPRRIPKVSVIVAAKDEEDNIESCVSSLLAQDYPNFELIAVDDRSDDKTPAILRGIMEDTRRPFRVVTIEELRPGWFGKNNAMREGVAASDGEWLLFTDADCRFDSKSAISIAVRDAYEHDVDFLSITPVLETRTWWERVIQPICAIVLIIWFLPSRVNNPAKKTSYANGAFMLMKRACYDAIGGHERVRTEVNEDIVMAASAKQQGFRLRVTENDGLYQTRMYATPRQAWRGWSRIFYGSLRSLRRVGLAATFLGFFSLFPWISLVVSLVAAAGAGWAEPWPWIVASWATVIAVLQIVVWRLYRVLKFAGPWSFSYPIGCVIVFAMLMNAMLKCAGARSTTWRGTTYRGDRRLDDRTQGAADANATAPHARNTTDCVPQLSTAPVGAQRQESS